MSNIPSSVDGLAQKAPILNYLIDPVKNHYMDFEGVATRQQYWMYVLVQALLFIGLGIVVGIVTVVLGFISQDIAFIVGLILGGVIGLISLALLLPSVAIAVRRLRDAGFTPWLLLLGIIGLAIIPLILCMLPSKDSAPAA